jgi:hypothetical protein
MLSFATLQDAGKVAMRQMLVILKPTGEQIPHEGNGLLIEALRVSLLNGNIEFSMMMIGAIP